MTHVETAPSSKVYCRDCLFFLEAQRYGQQRCLHPHAKYWIDTSVARVQRYRTPDDRNIHNDCQDFRRWRFWERIVTVDPKIMLGIVLLLSVVVVAAWPYLRR
jgi:hypothetical protein